MISDRRATLVAAVGFLGLKPREPELQLLHRRFDTWRGVNGRPSRATSGSPIWSQRGGVTGSQTRWWRSLLRGGGAVRAARGELLLGVLGAETLARDLDEVRAVRQTIEGG